MQVAPDRLEQNLVILLTHPSPCEIESGQALRIYSVWRKTKQHRHGVKNVEKRNPTHRTKELVLILNKGMAAVKGGRHCFTAPPEMLGLSA